MKTITNIAERVTDQALSAVVPPPTGVDTVRISPRGSLRTYAESMIDFSDYSPNSPSRGITCTRGRCAGETT